jgi:hypothetical protein
MRTRSAQKIPTVAKGIRWPRDMIERIEAVAKRDGLDFSPAVVELVRLGLERRAKKATS